MPRFSTEGAIGIASGVVLLILDKMNVGGFWVYIGLFLLAAILCFHSVLGDTTKSRAARLKGGISVLVVFLALGLWIFWPARKGTTGDADQTKKTTPETKTAKLRVQLWPRPEIKLQFLKDHDARLYLKSDNTQLDLTNFVPTDDFLDTTTDINSDLIGKPVNVTIAPREKYRVQQDRRYLTPVVRLEVYPLGKNPIPTVTELVTPSGEPIFRTTNLPLSSTATTFSADFVAHPDVYKIVASKSYLLDIKGTHLSYDTRLAIVDDKGRPVLGAWAGNEPGTTNGRPVEVNAKGTSFKVYFSAPPSAAGQKLFWRIEDSSSQIALAPVTVLESDTAKQ
jgi:hypothetical protein